MRRIFVLAACFVAHAAYGAQPRLASVSVQLNLSFVPRPVIADIALASTLQPSFGIPLLTPTSVMTAFHSGDAPAYLQAARAAQYEPPATDDHQTALYRLGLEREAADRAVRALDKVEAPAAKATVIDYAEFGRQLSRSGGVNLNPFQNTDAKRRILTAAGYSRLRGPDGPIPIGRASDVRVGKAFANVHRAFERRKRAASSTR